MTVRIEDLGVDMDKFTPTEKNILRFLEDGERHHRKDIKTVLYDDQVSDRALSSYISIIRSKLNEYGVIILCEYHRHNYFYRMVLPVSYVARVK